MGFVAVDLGASSTRYVSDNGKIAIMPNNMVMLPVDALVDVMPDDGSVDNSLEVVIKKEEASDYFPTKVLIGKMAEKYSSNNDRPSVLSNKHKQKINYVSGIVAAALSRLNSGVPEDINLYIALPPIEVKTAKEIVAEKFNGKYTVEFPKYMGGLAVKVNVISTTCAEESFLAMMSYFFKMEGTVREEAKQYMSGNVLSLDIGASTSDLAIVKDGRYLDKSGQTYKTGGNVARDYLINSIRGEYGFDLPLSDAETVMSEGRLKLGNTHKEVREIVSQAKRECARGIVQSMQTYFRQVDIPIQTIRAIVVSGGGSMHSQYVDENNEIVVTAEPMSSFITEAIKEICEGVDVVNHGENPRMANITGLFIRAMIDEAKRKQTNNQGHKQEVPKPETQTPTAIKVI